MSSHPGGDDNDDVVRVTGRCVQLLGVLLLAVALLSGCRQGDAARPDSAASTASGMPSTSPSASPPSASVGGSSRSSGVDAESGLLWVAESALPVQARRTLALIRAGGPYPYPRNDDQSFGNREGRLPAKPAGYYTEYTFVTPGEQDRGPRRIIAGVGGERYYTEDHYESYRRVREGA